MSSPIQAIKTTQEKPNSFFVASLSSLSLPDMPQKRLPKYSRTDESKAHFANTRITDIDLQIFAKLAFYRILPTSLLVRLVKGNERKVRWHLQKLYHLRYLDCFTIPRPAHKNPGEFVYVIQNTAALDLLIANGWAEKDELNYAEVENNAKRPYSDLNDANKAEQVLGRLLPLQHELMISRFHAMLELGCRHSEGKVQLVNWWQGADLLHHVTTPKLIYDPQHNLYFEKNEEERLSHEPDAFFSLRFSDRPEGEQDAHFFYEADRKTTQERKRVYKKLRAHFHYVVKQRHHREHYGVDRIRAVLIESIDPDWAEELRQCSRHKIVSGNTASPLFWFTPSTLFTHGKERVGKEDNTDLAPPYFLASPKIIFANIWATPADDKLYSLFD